MTKDYQEILFIVGLSILLAYLCLNFTSLTSDTALLVAMLFYVFASIIASINNLVDALSCVGSNPGENSESKL